MKLSIAVIVIGISIVCCIMTACIAGVAVYFTQLQSFDMDFGGSSFIGQAAPDFQLNTINGDRVSLHEFHGKPVMVNFWAVWCNPCVDEMPILQERYEQHSPDLVILAIEKDGDSPDVRELIEDHGLSFLVLEGQSSVAQKFNIHALPTSLFIDSSGVIQSLVVGSLTGPELDVELAKIGIDD